MESDELGNDMVRIDGGFLVDEDTYVVNSDDVLGKLLPLMPTLPTFMFSELNNETLTNGIPRVLGLFISSSLL